MITQVLRIRVNNEQGPRIRLWIPLLPVYLLLLPVLLLLAIAVLAACVYYRANPVRTLSASWQLIFGLRGFRADIEQGRTAVRVKIT